MTDPFDPDFYQTVLDGIRETYEFTVPEGMSGAEIQTRCEELAAGYRGHADEHRPTPVRS